VSGGPRWFEQPEPKTSHRFGRRRNIIIFRGINEMTRTVTVALLASMLAVGVGLPALQANASPVTLTFGDLVNGTNINSWFTGTQINPFYNPSNPATGPQFGPTDGVVFSSNSDELRAGTNGHAPAGGSGRFENNPSGVNGVLFFPFSTTTTSYLNDASGFTALSLTYSLLNNLGSNSDTVSLYSGLSGGGTLLATLTLDPAGTTVGCTTSGDEFCTWTSAATTSNFGVAESAVFASTSTVLNAEFDEVQLTPTPLPSTWLMLLSSFVGLGIFVGLGTKNLSAAAAVA
jgi:hypothetical protein